MHDWLFSCVTNGIFALATFSLLAQTSNSRIVFGLSKLVYISHPLFSLCLCTPNKAPFKTVSARRDTLHLIQNEAHTCVNFSLISFSVGTSSLFVKRYGSSTVFATWRRSFGPSNTADHSPKLSYFLSVVDQPWNETTRQTLATLFKILQSHAQKSSLAHYRCTSTVLGCLLT